ncbi:nucleolar RNA helicase 2 [Protopterus annectens]|uniref:nucleolar RNA helicase 2 n=1 Tax=Protopterus annectens TaxID=7888 RepID=UPI001CF96F44|nr:nucleolar RNA helicase 2 [Protopterus annectens]
MPGKLLSLSDQEDMENGSAAEYSETEHKKHKKHKKEKKEKKKSKKSEKRKKHKREHSEEATDPISPPKPKKQKLSDEEDANSDSSVQERRELSSVITNGFSEAKTTSQSGEESGECESEPEQELTLEQREGAFSNFQIAKGTVDLLKARGVEYLFPIQVKTFDHVSSGKDLIAQARTGTGKTFSFAIPLIEKLQGNGPDKCRGRSPKVLVLTPTRELALQVTKDFKDITRQLSIVCFYGGTAYNAQIASMRNGIDILVGTPGRIKDHLQNNKLDLTKLKHVVLDEVDQMLDMGFAEQVEEILKVAYKKDSPENPQTLLFSATCPSWVYDVAKKYMRPKFEQIDLIGKKTQKTATTVEHLAIECHWSQREAVIGDVIQVYSGSHGRTIVFCETKKDVDQLVLNSSIKQDAQGLHGDIPQKQREVTLKGFRSGTFGVLVATNVAARGLDIPEVDLVIQSSPPKDVESYIHRSGRTGRAGRTGVCICFYQRKEADQLRYVEQKAGIRLRRTGLPSVTYYIEAQSTTSIRFLDSIPESAIEHFRPAAERLIEEKGAVEALAAALAHITGAKSIEQRSLLNSDAGFVTMLLTCSVEMHNIGYAWRGLKEQLGEDIEDKVKRMRFLKGKMGVCFDVPAASVKEFQDNWVDSRRWQFSIATELPELEGDKNSSDFRKGRPGGFRRNDRFRNRGQSKRNFGRSSNSR